MNVLAESGEDIGKLMAIVSILRQEVRGINSIILVGSRAIGRVSPSSDYDLYIRSPLGSTILLLLRHSTLARKLECVLGVKATVFPITTRRLRTGSDVLLMKLKKNGRVLWGEDFKHAVKPDSFRDLSQREWLLHLSTAALYLLKSAALLFENTPQEMTREALRMTHKSFELCDELRSDLLAQIESPPLLIENASLSVGEPDIKSSTSCEFRSEVKYWCMSKDFLLAVLARTFGYADRDKFVQDVTCGAFRIKSIRSAREMIARFVLSSFLSKRLILETLNPRLHETVLGIMLAYLSSFDASGNYDARHASKLLKEIRKSCSFLRFRCVSPDYSKSLKYIERIALAASFRL